MSLFKKSIITPRSKHSISRENIPKNVLTVLYSLKKAGFAAYLVGGGVRDLLAGFHPKDFDIATDARPEQIKRVFRNCRLIGRRFRLAHVFFGREIVEVATFRGPSGNKSAKNNNGAVTRKFSEHGMLMRDNVYGTLEEDAWRRDLTINSLYYNISDYSIVDYTDGMKDMKKGIIRMIGDPVERYHEDPVRMLRAVRIAAKLSFKIEKATKKPIIKLAGLLQNVPSARLFDEIMKWFKSGKSATIFEALREYGLFPVLFPQTEASLVSESPDDFPHKFLSCAFESTDARCAADKPSNPAFLFSVLLWWPLQKAIATYSTEGVHPVRAFLAAKHEVLKKQKERIDMTNRIMLTTEEIWVLQYRMLQRKKSKITLILHHPKFRAAYDFLLLRIESGEEALRDCAEWWTEKMPK